MQIPKNVSEDPMRKREEFAVSLRKKKKQTILANKRMKLIMARPIEETKNNVVEN